MTPARATAMIQVAAQLPAHVGDEHGVALRLGAGAAAPRRMPMSAARSARVICGASDRWRGTRPAAAPASSRARTCVELRSSSVGARLEGQRVGVRLLGALEIAGGSRGSRRSARATRASLGSSATALRRCSSAASTSPLLTLDAGQLPIQERAVRRAARWRVVYARTASSSRPARAASRATRQIPARRPRNLSTSTRRPTSASDRIGSQRRLERRQRVAVAVQAPASASPRPTSAGTFRACRLPGRDRTAAARPSASLRASST